MSKCWVCESEELILAKRANIEGMITRESFGITDSKYGTTGELHLCKNCGFLQCPELKDVLPFYEALQDRGYEDTRAERALQMKKILNLIQKYKPGGGKLLDIGAGSGILVGEAAKIGYNAEGIEPSKWLHNKAKEHRLQVHLGVLPHPEVQGPYDVVTIVDVIEHVSDPLTLLSNIYDVVSEDSIIVAVTPDLGSFVARTLGWKWWHYRIAHIGYFNKNTFEMAFEKAGFRLISMHRSSWYFTADYLLERVNTYLPRIMRIPVCSFLKKITIPLNLRDSLLGIFVPFNMGGQ